MVGLDTSNFPDAMALLRDAQAVVESSPQELAETLRKLVDNPNECKRLAKAGNEAWLAARGASDRCDRLLGRVPPSGGEPPS